MIKEGKFWYSTYSVMGYNYDTKKYQQFPTEEEYYEMLREEENLDG